GESGSEIVAGIGIARAAGFKNIGTLVPVTQLRGVVSPRTATKGPGACAGWHEQLLHCWNRTIVQIRGSRPNSSQSRSPIFLRAADARLAWGLVTMNFQLREKFIESTRLDRVKQLRAARFGADLSGPMQPVLVLRSIVTGSALRLVMGRASTGCYLVDRPGITRGADSLG